MTHRHIDGNLVVVGAGPAGVAAAVTAARHSAGVILIDDNPHPGGQIWRGAAHSDEDATAGHWLDELRKSAVQFFGSHRVVDADASRQTLLLESPSGVREVCYGRLILATGARELYLPFPGWTLPNVFGAGGLQALAKSGLPVEGKRIVVAGSGPLLLAVAAYLRSAGASVKLIAEQAGFSALCRFGAEVTLRPKKWGQAVSLALRLLEVPYRTSTWVLRAEGQRHLERVQVRSGRRVWWETCDYLAIGYGLVPNTDLAQLLGCAVSGDGAGVDGVAVDSQHETSVKNVFCAGESTGVGGAEMAILEGEVAALSVLREAIPPVLRRKLSSERRFAGAMAAAFRPRRELGDLPESATLVCRCEDVDHSTLRQAASWKEGKLHFRCGMGPCQGRICGPAARFLYGWRPESVRPPLFPVPVGELVREGSKESITEG